MGKIVLMANQKGGAGKSTLVTFFANALHREGNNILVADCDPQRSVLRTREDVTKQAASESYEIRYMPIETAAEELAEVAEDYDVIFVDMPGNLSADGLIKLWVVIDAFCFVGELAGHSIKSFDDTIKVYRKLQQTLADKGIDTKPIEFGILNKVEHHEKEEAEDYLSKAPAIWNFPWLDQYVPQLKVLKSLQSVEPYRHSSNNYKLDKVLDQFKEAINL